ANQLLNGNYPRFISEFLLELKKHKLVIICNEKADLSKSELSFIKEFRIGRNAMINQMNLHEEISEWMITNDIHDVVILSSASSLSNITAYELYKKHKDIFFIDIGTTLAPVMGLGCPRTYLKNYWIDKKITGDLAKVCIW
ncbi:hypothetical protein, partial [Mycoplasmopsis arginini]|uniref:hypothetical protein n=1 Tax=Mycoplasmopsis arginini TaxID=2094 RepID=UPI00249F6D67